MEAYHTLNSTLFCLLLQAISKSEIERKILSEKNMNLAECDSTAGYTKSILCHAVKSSLCNLHALDTMS